MPGEHHSSHHSSSHTGSQKKKKKRFSKRKLKKYAPVIVVAILFPAILLGIYLWEEKRGEEEQPDSAEMVILPSDETAAVEMTFFDGGWYAPRSGLETTLVMGIDKNADFEIGEGDKHEQADFLMLMVADKETETYTAIPINRDTMTEIQMLTANGAPVRTITDHLCLAHIYGNRAEIGCKNTVLAVSNLLGGVNIDHYLSLSMDGVAVLNDAVGGVPVVVMDDFTGVDDTLVQGQTVVLRGQHTLNYIRARRSMAVATNVHRMERQQQYMASLQSQFSRQADADESFIVDTMMTVSDYLVSDCTVNQLSDLLEELHDFESTGFRSLPGEVVYREYAEFYPDEQALRQLVMDVFYERVENL